MKIFMIIAGLFLGAYSYATFAEVILVKDCMIVQAVPGFSPDPDQDGVPTFCFDKLEIEDHGFERESEKPFDTCSNVYNPDQLTPLDKYDNNCNGIHDSQDWNLSRVWVVQKLLGNYVGDYDGDGVIIKGKILFPPGLGDVCTMQIEAKAAGFFPYPVYNVGANCVN